MPETWRDRPAPALRIRGAAAAVAVLLSSFPGPPASAGAQELVYSGSLQYSTGSYVFGERTHGFNLFTGLGVRSTRFDVSADVPLIVQNGGVVSYTAEAPLPTGGTDHEALRRRDSGGTIPTRRDGGGRGGMGRSAGLGFAGATDASAEPTDTVTFSDDFDAHLGDPFVQGSSQVFSGFGTLRSLRISGGVKLPLAGLESGVGTGQWDYTAGASLMVAVWDLYFFGDLSWWWFGDMPDLALEDGPSYGLAVGRPVFGSRGSVLLTFSGARSAIATVDAPAAVGLSLGYTVRDGRSLSVGGSAGLSESSPDLSVFLGWTLDL